MALHQILCPQVQSLRSSPGLRIITQKVGDLDLIGDSSNGIFRPLVPRDRDKYLNTYTGPPTLADRQLAASSPPGMYGKVSPQMSPPGRRLAWAASEPKSTAMSRYPLNTFRYPPAVSATSM
jgi:hypothetical protein